MTKPERIEKLLALLTVAFCWAYKIGEWRHTEKAITLKKHGRKSQSYFRYGLDYLRDISLNRFYQSSLDKLFIPLALLASRDYPLKVTP